jgi:hypothetical protein
MSFRSSTNSLTLQPLAALLWTYRTTTYSKRLLSLAAQKFVNDIASDAFHYAKLRMNAPSAKTGKAGSKVSWIACYRLLHRFHAGVLIPCLNFGQSDLIRATRRTRARLS